MAATSTRRSAAERRGEIIEIAIEHFALRGYNGTSTDQVAREAGISQPYLFRLFRTKRELFLACHEVMHGRIAETFAAAARGLPPEERMPAMAKAYTDLLADRTSLLFQMQSYAASPIPRSRRGCASATPTSCARSARRRAPSRRSCGRSSPAGCC